MFSYLQPLRQRYAALLRRNRYAPFDPADALIIASSPRGGSSWLAETLSRVPRTALLWEPLHIRNVPPFREIGFGWRQHIPEHMEWEGARHTFERLFRGSISNEWIRRGASRRTFAEAERLLVKFVRANALLPWLTQQFRFRHPPVLLVRHPFGVAASQTVRFKPKARFRNDQRSEVYAEHAAYLQTLHSWEEIITATWCLTTLPLLRHPANNKRWLTVAYEELLTAPEHTLASILTAWQLPISADLLEQVQRPSSTTDDATFLRGADAQLRKWQHQFDTEQVARMRAVLDYFEVEFYDEGTMPLVDFRDRKPRTGRSLVPA